MKSSGGPSWQCKSVLVSVNGGGAGREEKTRMCDRGAGQRPRRGWGQRPVRVYVIYKTGILWEGRGEMACIY